MKDLTFLLIAGLLIFPFASFGQNDGNRRAEMHEKIKAAKVAFISTQLELNSAEGEKFWPIFNEYEQELVALKKTHKGDKMKYMNPEEMSDQEILNMMDSKFKMEQASLDLKKKYHDKFKAILTVKKLGKFYFAQDEFRKHLMNKIKGEYRGKKGQGTRDNG